MATLRGNKQYNPNKRRGDRITAWSFSRWNTYRTCPAQAFYKYIQKLPEPESPALVNGSRVHDLGEAYVKAGDTSAPVPVEYEGFTDELHAAMELNPRAELELAFTNKWTPTTWFHSNVWLRAKIDLVYEGISPKHINLVDYKTGKVRVDEQQLELYAIAMLCAFKEVDHLHTELWFLSHDKVAEVDHDRSELRELKAKWRDRAHEMTSDKVFRATPSFACRWCPFNANTEAQGPCEYGRK